jgi:type IV pilus assembly protein PilN
MKITLNLATRPYIDMGPALRQLRIVIGGLLVLSVGCAFGLHLLHNQAEQVRAQARALDARIAEVGAERLSYQSLMQKPDNALLLRQTDALNKLFELKAFSWTLAMENLETVLPAGVQVSTLEPTREKDGHISVRLRVVGPRDRAVDLVRNLEHSKRFLMPRIVGENAETSSGMNAMRQQEPISASSRFTVDIIADYNPPAPGERKPTLVAVKQEGPLAAPAPVQIAGRPMPMQRPMNSAGPGFGNMRPPQASHFDPHQPPPPGPMRHSGKPSPYSGGAQ